MNLIDYHRPAVLLYPSKMLYPGVLPLVTMFDALFKDAAASQRKLKVFWIAFFWLVNSHTGMSLTKHWTDLQINVLIELMTASFFGSYFRSGCSLFSQDFQYSASPIQGRKTSHESLEAPMETKDLVCCPSASIGSIFQEVRMSPNLICADHT